MGIFSTPKCPIHRTPYSIHRGMFEDSYYCKKCRQKAQAERDAKEQSAMEIQSLEERVKELENKFNQP